MSESTRILLNSGDYFDIEDLDGFIPRIEDIAWGLSNVCRYAGQGRFFSVAEHSVWVSLRLPRHLALWGLLHDAAEAFIGDLAGPLKHSGKFGDFRHVEAQIMERVILTFRLLPRIEPPEVKQMDRALQADERKLVFSDSVQAFRPFKPTDAYREFMARFHELRL